MLCPHVYSFYKTNISSTGFLRMNLDRVEGRICSDESMYIFGKQCRSIYSGGSVLGKY